MAEKADHEGRVNVTIESGISHNKIKADIPRNQTVATAAKTAAYHLGDPLVNAEMQDRNRALKLVKNDTRMQDDKRIGDYNIEDGDVLVLYEEAAAGLSGGGRP